jgi:hypothetical protein
MRFVLLAAALATSAAQAELYRWIDPDSGSVKYSTLPPADPRVRPEVVPFKGPATAVAPARSATVPQPAAQSGSFGGLQVRWNEFLTRLAGLTPADLARPSDALRKQLEAWETVTAELDRLDPMGAARRRAQAESALGALKTK